MYPNTQLYIEGQWCAAAAPAFLIGIKCLDESQVALLLRQLGIRAVES